LTSGVSDVSSGGDDAGDSIEYHCFANWINNLLSSQNKVCYKKKKCKCLYLEKCAKSKTVMLIVKKIIHKAK